MKISIKYLVILVMVLSHTSLQYGMWRQRAETLGKQGARYFKTTRKSGTSSFFSRTGQRSRAYSNIAKEATVPKSQGRLGTLLVGTGLGAGGLYYYQQYQIKKAIQDKAYTELLTSAENDIKEINNLLLQPFNNRSKQIIKIALEKLVDKATEEKYDQIRREKVYGSARDDIQKKLKLKFEQILRLTEKDPRWFETLNLSSPNAQSKIMIGNTFLDIDLYAFANIIEKHPGQYLNTLSQLARYPSKDAVTKFKNKLNTVPLDYKDYENYYLPTIQNVKKLIQSNPDTAWLAE